MHTYMVSHIQTLYARRNNMSKMSYKEGVTCPDGNYVALVYADYRDVDVLFIRKGDVERIGLDIFNHDLVRDQYAVNKSNG